MSWRDAHRAAAGAEGRSDVLCLGDSRIKLGLLPRLLEDRLGVSAYNLGILGGQAPASYFLLRQGARTRDPPRAILVDFSESLLSFSPSRNAACLADWLGRRESLEVAWHCSDPALAVSTALHWLLPGWCDESDRGPLLGFGSASARRERSHGRSSPVRAQLATKPRCAGGALRFCAGRRASH